MKTTIEAAGLKLDINTDTGSTHIDDVDCSWDLLSAGLMPWLKSTIHLIRKSVVWVAQILACVSLVVVLAYLCGLMGNQISSLISTNTFTSFSFMNFHEAMEYFWFGYVAAFSVAASIGVGALILKSICKHGQIAAQSRALNIDR